MTPEELDEQLGRIGRSKPARWLGWLAVAGWCVYVALCLWPYVR